ncbi:MAG: formylglycine-generating enzyme family protein [Paludibacter sp.]
MKKKCNYSIHSLLVLCFLINITSSCKTEEATASKPPTINTSLIQAGTFTMGSPMSELDRDTSETQHRITLSAYRMSKCQIMNAQYAAFLNDKNISNNGLYAAGAYPTKTLIFDNSENYDWGLHYSNNKWLPVPGYENNPVIDISWYGAVEFATYVGGTLPTEAQWEYACRAGTTTPFSTGNCITNLQANYNWSYPYGTTCTNTVTTNPGKPQLVSTYPANAYGLYDMPGNVYEWCADRYSYYTTNSQTNPTGAVTGSERVVRGCSCFGRALECRSANRYYESTEYEYSNYQYASEDLGFRVVFVP